MNKKAQELQILEILDVIQVIASGDYSRKVKIEGRNDSMEALATGINMLGEKLEAAKKQVRKIRELHTNNKQILEKLEYESSLIRTLLENTEDNMYFKDLESRFIRVSRSMAEKAGFKDPMELLGKTDHDLFSNEHASQALRDEKRIIKTKAPLSSLEEHEIWRDGAKHWVRTSKMPWINEKGEIIGTFGISHDITKSKKWEMELSESEERYRKLVQNMGEGIGVVDEEERFLFVNPAAGEIFGVLPEKLVGQNLKDFIDAEGTEKLSRETTRRKKGAKSTYELNIIRPDKARRNIQVTATPNFNDKSQFAETFGIFRDTTEEYLLRQEIRERKEFLDSITSTAKDAIVSIDHRGRVTFWNLSAEGLFGYKKEEIMGRNFHDIMVPAEYHDAHKKGFIQFLKTGKGNAIGQSIELFALHKSGKKFPVELSLSSMKVNDHWSAVGIIRDITERKIIENRLKKAKGQAEQANRAKSEFLANISHEIRTPLNAILGFSEILENQVAADPEIRDYITGIKNSGRGLLRLINDILDLSKIEAGKLEIKYSAVNPKDMINELGQIYMLKTREKGLFFDTNIEEGLPSGLMLDETRLRQILFNLIGNAVKFTDSGGITVNVKWLDRDNDGSKINLAFEIIDTGIGIPAKELDQIFKPFVQTEGQSIRKYGGTGLGLTITRRLVNLMNGTMKLESTLNAGSKFSVFLPGIEVAVSRDKMEKLHSSKVSFQFHNAHILHIEDIESSRKIIRGYLRTQNIKITEAENGKTGIEKARKLKPDLILMDIQMPEMDGLEATRILKSDPAVRDIPVIILTSSALKEDREKFRNLCDGYLRKPVAGEDLVNELARFLPHISTEPVLEDQAETRKNFIELTRDEFEEKGTSPELGIRFRDVILPEYEAILRNKSNLRIRNFAALVTETGLEYKIGCLEKYGELLSQHTGTFNVGKIDHMLLEFKGISEIILIR